MFCKITKKTVIAKFMAFFLFYLIETAHRDVLSLLYALLFDEIALYGSIAKVGNGNDLTTAANGNTCEDSRF